MTKTKGLFLAVAFATIGITFSGCTTRVGQFSVISTKNIDWSRANEYTRSTSQTKGKNMAHIIILIQTKLQLTVGEAVDNALKQVPGAVALVDASLDYKNMYVPLIYGQTAYIVTGTALIDPQLADKSQNNSTEYLVLNSADGETFTKSSVSKEEFENLSMANGL